MTLQVPRSEIAQNCPQKQSPHILYNQSLAACIRCIDCLIAIFPWPSVFLGRRLRHGKVRKRPLSRREPQGRSVPEGWQRPIQGGGWAVLQEVRKKHPKKCAGVEGRRVRALGQQLPAQRQTSTCSDSPDQLQFVAWITLSRPRTLRSAPLCPPDEATWPWYCAT